MYGSFCDIYSPNAEKNNLNIIEAYKRMASGYKITHEFFNDNEFLYLDEKGVVRDEKDYNFDYGWDLRLNDKTFYLGWSIKEDI